jgi:hypothetical protein
MKRSLRAMKDSFKGRTIAVLGGGPSLPGDLEKIDNVEFLPDTVLISVNHHAARLVVCNYMVFADDPIQWPDFYEIQKEYIGRRLSTICAYSDFEHDCVKWFEGMSSSLATWFACHLGGDPVLLCGMDCYTGDAYYYERTGYDATKETRKELKHHLRPWLNAKIICPNSENIRAVSGPLIELFGGWNAKNNRR